MGAASSVPEGDEKSEAQKKWTGVGVLHARQKEGYVDAMAQQQQPAERRVNVVQKALFQASIKHRATMKVAKKSLQSAAKLTTGTDMWTVDPDTVVQVLKDCRNAPQNSAAKGRALHSLYHLTFKSPNRLIMLNCGVLETLIEEVRSLDTESKHQLLVIGSLRNLSLNLETKFPMARLGVHDALIALTWLSEGTLLVKTLGTILNLSLNSAVGVMLLKSGITRVVFAKIQSTDDQVQGMATLILYNMVANKRTDKAPFRTEALDALRLLLVKTHLVGLVATIATMLLVGSDRDSPLIVFQERQKNVKQVVQCLELSLQGKPMYGLQWAPDNLVFALATMALFEQSRRKMAKLGLYKHLTDAVDRNTKVHLGDSFTEDVAIELRALIKPILVELGLAPADGWRNPKAAKPAGAKDMTSVDLQRADSFKLMAGGGGKREARRAIELAKSNPVRADDDDDDDEDDLQGRGVMPF